MQRDEAGGSRWEALLSDDALARWREGSHGKARVVYE